MNIASLARTAADLLAPGNGLLAIGESPSTRDRRFRALGIAERVEALTSTGKARGVVSVDGEADVDDVGVSYRLRRGEVLVLPAVVGVCLVRPIGDVTVLELSLPEGGAL